MKKTIYLDYNATAPMRPAVIELVSGLLGTPHNASSVHKNGREGKRLIDAARRQIAALTGADANNVIFNSGATEANNTVLKYFADGKVCVSAIEHPSVLEARPDAIHLPVTPAGIIDLGAAESIIAAHKPALVSCQLVNSETGIIQPVAKVSQIARRYGAYFHCDAVQAAGRIPLNIMELGIDFMTLSSHKIGGPQGVGALVLGLCGETPTLLDGGGQEKKARAGTENVAGIAGFGLAAELALAGLNALGEAASADTAISGTASPYDSRSDSPHDSRSDIVPLYAPTLEIRLCKINKDIKIYGKNEKNEQNKAGETAPLSRVPNTTFFSAPGVSSETLLMAFDLEGICVSNGSACSSGTVKPSATLKAMGADDAEASSAIRVSTGWNTSQGDIDAFLNAFEKIMARL